MDRVILADKSGVTHWYIARIAAPGRSGKPQCNFGNLSSFIVTETKVPPVPWPTCLLCATRT